jgi:putative DNA primase/helicase
MTTATHKTNGRPTIQSVDRSAIHDGLHSFDRWTCWRYECRNGKWTKPPIDARTLNYGNSTKPETWCSINEAFAAHRPGVNGVGIGFVLGEADSRVHFSGIDLDGCRDPITGELSDVAKDIIAMMDTYTEVSPSGTGIKLLMIGKLPLGHATKNKVGSVEIYSAGRYFTITGRRIDGTPKRVEARQLQLEAVWKKYIGSEQVRPERKTSSSANGYASDAALRAMLRIRPDENENDGSNRLLAVCCRAVEHDLSDDAAVSTVREYEQSHPFPSNWSDDDIIRRLRDAERRAERGAALHSTIQNCTDYGNCERFAEQHGTDVRFCHLWDKWLVWDGRRWAIDEHGEVIRLAKRTVRNIYVEASKALDPAEAKAIAKWAATSEKRERLTAMIALAESEQPIPVAVESLDSHPWLLNVENGTIDLRTGELREHRRDDYLTKLCPVEYPTEPGDDPDLWLAFLKTIFAENDEMIRFVQQLVGSALVGEVIEHVLALLYGVGANGKSVFLETICGMLGPDYAMNAPAGLLMASKSNRHPTELADLHGKRFVAAVETADGGRLSEALVKELTGGDSIRARRMRENFWQFRPSHTVVLATNHKPTIRGTDHGIWRRIRLVPFTVTIPDDKQDKQLAVKLRAEWAQILRWAVAGCIDWQRNGLTAPDEVTKATSSYRADMDVLGEFLSDRCITGDNFEAQASVLYKAYRSWATDRSEHIDTQTRFGTRLTERGFEKSRNTTNGRWYYQRLGLIPEGSE